MPRWRHAPGRAAKSTLGARLFAVPAFDRDTLEVRCRDQRIELIAKELAILELLMMRPGHVLSRERILNVVWGDTADPLTNVVDVYIGRVRRKLAAARGPSIDTVRGHGYRLASDGNDA